MLHAVEHLNAALYTRAIRKNWITWEATGRVHWTTYQFAWLVVTQIVSGNHHGIR